MKIFTSHLIILVHLLNKILTTLSGFVTETNSEGQKDGGARGESPVIPVKLLGESTWH